MAVLDAHARRRRTCGRRARSPFLQPRRRAASYAAAPARLDRRHPLIRKEHTMRTLILATVLLLPAAAFARDWNVDAAKSTLGFKGSYQKEAFAGSFKKFDATITYDAADLAKAKFDVTVDLASADTSSAERDDTLKGSDFFATAKFPKA